MQGVTPKAAVKTGGAVFLSYASQNAAAARRLCNALRAAGVEVWFDQAELRGGDAWDQKIRRQIKDCALFVALVSAETQARTEGYFRLEWRLADQRTHQMARNKAFIVPVAIDATPDAGADVPESFIGVQWTRLAGGQATPEFCARIVALARGADADDRPAAIALAPPRPSGRRRWIVVLAAGAGIMLALFALQRWRLPSSALTGAAAPSSAATRLEDQARELLLKRGGASSRLETAELLATRALALDPADADALALASEADARTIAGAIDQSPERIERARARAAQAINLAPTAFEPRLAQAVFLVYALGQPLANNAEPDLIALHAVRPNEPRVLETLGALRRSQGRTQDALAYFDEWSRIPGGAVGALSEKAWGLTQLRRMAEAETAADQSIALRPFAGNVAIKVYLQMNWHGDLDGALATLRKMPAEDQLDDVGIAAAVKLYRWRREPANVLTVLAAVPRDWITWSMWAPKAALTGDAHAELRQSEAARADWGAALKLIEARLILDPNNRRLLDWQAYLKSELGDVVGARAAWRRAQELPPASVALLAIDKIQRLGTADEILDSLDRRSEGQGAFLSAAELRLNPAWDAIRALPRFQALAARLNEDPNFSPTALLPGR